ncbi:MAG: DUF6527 family protein [Candidatus Egerieousia sp.]
MFSRTWTSKSTESYSQKIEHLKAELQSADAILIGAGSGLSASAGLTYGGARFLKYFSDFHEKYGITNLYSGGFYPFPSLEEYWAWWSRHIYYNRYDVTPGKPYADLLELVRGRNYFVLTTKVELNLNKESSPSWTLKWHVFGTISFSPSIWRKNGCRSHFFLKKSLIYWCP